MGIIIVIIGALLLLKTTGVYDTSVFLDFVPSIFVLVGVWALYKSDFRNITGPALLIVLFGTLQLLTLDLIGEDTISNWWPLILVAIGLAVLLHRTRRPKMNSKKLDKVDIFTVFGGSESSIGTSSFLGGDITVIFGGTDLDLRDCEIGTAPAELNVFILFGGAEVKVPEDWTVKMDVLPLLGGASDERPRSRDRIENRKGKPDLVVTGFAMFGGLSVKD